MTSPCKVVVRSSRRWKWLFGIAVVLTAIRWFGRSEDDNASWIASGGLPTGEYVIREVKAADEFLVSPVDNEVGESRGATAPARVRLLGVGILPESQAVAQEFVATHVAATGLVRIRLDRRRIAPDGTFLVYVFYSADPAVESGERLLNAELIARGWASDATHPADSSQIRRMMLAAAQAASDVAITRPSTSAEKHDLSEEPDGIGDGIKPADATRRF